MDSTISEWITPATRPELIENLVSGVDRYNPSNVGILEDYLYHQIRNQEYDCLANLAILKLYQFNPDLYNADVVINILIKAMTSAHFPDFNLCLSLLDERPLHLSLDRDEPDPLPTILPTLTAMNSLLHRCRFMSFWELYRSEELEDLRDNYTIECIGFDDSVRNLVVRSVRPTFTKISAERLGAYLDLSGAELEDYVKNKLGWTMQGHIISTPPDQENQIESTVVQETIKMPQLTKIIAYAAQSG